ncbi:hypothetical protein BH24ACT5_BH24ACT5_30080 [soil metagenome]
MFTAPDDAPDFDPFVCAPAVRVPTLFVMSPDDEMPGAASDVTRAVFDRIPGPAEHVDALVIGAAGSGRRELEVRL